MSTLLGIDGCPGGWIALSLDTKNQNLELIQRAHWNHLPWRRCTLAAANMPGDQARIHETHPELVFHCLSGGTPLPSKREAAGEQARLHLLRSADLPDITPHLHRLPRKTASPNDVIDAAACLLTALRLLRGEARCLPARPPLDRRGLRMEIWY